MTAPEISLSILKTQGSGNVGRAERGHAGELNCKLFHNVNKSPTNGDKSFQKKGWVVENAFCTTLPRTVPFYKWGKPVISVMCSHMALKDSRSDSQLHSGGKKKKLIFGSRF